MHTKETLLADMAITGVPREATVLIHTSMKTIGEVEGGADTVLDVLSEYFAPGLLILPTHTWVTVFEDGDVFDPQQTLSCVGILPNLFWQRPGTVRSWHPTHSVAALGADASQFVAGEESKQTPCPRDGVYGRLVDRNAYILFLGAPFTKNTFVHGVEEWNNVPNRLAEEAVQLRVRTPGGELIAAPQHRHDAPIRSIYENYGKLGSPLTKVGGFRSARFGDADLLITKARAVEQVASALLSEDPDVFLDGDKVDPAWQPPGLPADARV